MIDQDRSFRRSLRGPLSSSTLSISSMKHAMRQSSSSNSFDEVAKRLVKISVARCRPVIVVEELSYEPLERFL